MDKAIRLFPEQFSYNPVIKNARRFKPARQFVVSGMGGSQHASGFLSIRDPYLKIVRHRNYGLPNIPAEELRQSLIIASSYSGNTEETIDCFNKAVKKRLNVAAIAIGGKLARLAKKYKTPYVLMPDTGIEPRLAMGFSLKSMMKLTGKEEWLKEISILLKTLKSNLCEKRGKEMAALLHNKVPVIYSSHRLRIVAYIWKITFNETGKIPAFSNVFPELNHNEINGFDVVTGTKKLSKKFHFIFLKDEDDNPRIKKRMDVTKKMYIKQGLGVTVLPLKGAQLWQRLFTSVLIVEWASYYTALSYGASPDGVPMVEELKDLLKK